MFGLKNIASRIGIKGIGHTRGGPKGQSIPVYAILDKGLIRNWINNSIFPVRGVSLYPIGVFVLAQEINIELLKHECFHYEEQSKCGIVNWLTAYYGEIAALSIKHGSLRQGYYHSSHEQRAIDWSKST